MERGFRSIFRRLSFPEGTSWRDDLSTGVSGSADSALFRGEAAMARLRGLRPARGRFQHIDVAATPAAVEACLNAAM